LLVRVPPTVSTVAVVLKLLITLFVPDKTVVPPNPSDVFGPFPVSPLPPCVNILPSTELETVVPAPAPTPPLTLVSAVVAIEVPAVKLDNPEKRRRRAVSRI
jgi:hypothetical protein